MAEFRKQNALQTGFIMSIFSLQRHLVYVLINFGLAFTFRALLNISSGMSADALIASLFFFLPLLRHNQSREGDIMQWVSERGFYLIYTMLNFFFRKLRWKMAGTIVIKCME
jgi:hypothetical protein